MKEEIKNLKLQLNYVCYNDDIRDKLQTVWDAFFELENAYDREQESKTPYFIGVDLANGSDSTGYLETTGSYEDASKTLREQFKEETKKDWFIYDEYKTPTWDYVCWLEKKVEQLQNTPSNSDHERCPECISRLIFKSINEDEYWCSHCHNKWHSL